MGPIDFDQLGREAFRLIDPIEPWRWAKENVNYSLAPNYDTPYKGPFDPELMPFWKEPLEMARDRGTREIVIRKPARAGFSENLLLTDLRYTVAREPEPTIYISGKMDLTTGFLDRRVIRGMGLSRETAAEFRRSKAVKQDIQFPRMDFRATWITSDTATKQDGWARIYADEVSLWGEVAVDQVRKRADAYPFHHIIWGSSIDPFRKGDPNQDPILKLYDESDKRVWLMEDPAGGFFSWSFSGIRWPDECKDPATEEWDLERALKESWYETPNGTRIEESERMKYTRSGFWKPTTDKSTRVGYWITAPMIPFEACSFGNLAMRFLSAKHRINKTATKEQRHKNTLRSYFAEYWAEAHQEEEQKVQDETLKACEGDYEIGNIWVPGDWTTGVIATCDVQKYHIWWLCRSWAYDAKTEKAYSSLLDYGNAASFDDLDAKLGGFQPSLTGIDIGYSMRQSEVADYCAQYTAGDVKESAVMALRGSDKLESVPLNWVARDAMEGRTGKGMTPFLEITWATDIFRSKVIELMDGGSGWYIPNQWRNGKEQAEYVKQAASTKKVDGIWTPPSHRQDHLFDCEAQQLVMARWDGMI